MHTSRCTAIGIVWAMGISLAWAQGGFGGPGRYEILNLQSGKVIDLDRNDQTTVIQFQSRGTDNQQWDFQPAGRRVFLHIERDERARAGGDRRQQLATGRPAAQSRRESAVAHRGGQGRQRADRVAAR
jgi:hypothetical protein